MFQARRLVVALSAVLMLGSLATLLNAEAAATAPAASATGTWTWSQPGRNGGADMVTTLVLKQDGEKLTGTLTPGMPNATASEIKDGTIKDGDLSFNVVRTRNGTETTTKYTGKLDGDTIKGKIEMNFNGQARTREFEAKRVVESTTKPTTQP